jgi:hypothetical protein
MVMNRWSCRALCRVEENESSVLFLCHGKLGWLLRLSAAPMTSQVGTSRFLMNIREEEAFVVGDFVNHEL